MSISSVNAQRQKPYALVQLDASGPRVTQTQSTSGAEEVASTAHRKNQEVNLQIGAKSVMEKYDLTHITYSDMAKLGKELVDAGALPEDKLLDFIPLEPGRIGVDGTVRESSTEPVNMIEHQLDILKSIKMFGGKGADYAAGVLNMYKNFQSLHDQANVKRL